MQQGLSLSTGARSLSPAPTTSHANKRRRHDLSKDNTGQPGEDIEAQRDDLESSEGREAGESGENTNPDHDTHVSILNQ